jgi:glycosyltransferase involved in cell wall biosynthesis
MKISIVTISYNQAPFLERTIRSVLDQDYPDVDYIVVDPGSTDGSREIIERYRGRISKIILEPDKGPADGLNKGFAKASGAVFGFLNSDDELLPGAIRRVADHFAAHPQADILMGHTFIVNEEGQLRRRSYTDRFQLRSFAYGGGIICQHSTFFRGVLFREVGGFNINNSVAWDAELFLELLLKAKCPLYVEDFLANFRIHGKSITGGNKMQEKIRAYERERFARIMGRPWRATDWIFWLFYRVRKHLTNRRGLMERLRRGSIMGRK